jgi:serine/threonine-protein kinase
MVANRAELQALLKDYWVGKTLGTGARSEIAELKRKSDGQLFAVKFISVANKEDLRVIGHLENEYHVLTALHAQKNEATDVIIRPLEFRKVKRLFKVRAAYLVMERARGRSLAEFRDYALHDVLVIFRQVCLALEHMHRLGYVHADIKPQNILVNGNLKVKLVDFGFAAPIGQQLDAYKGTFGYLAPEQAAGRLTEKTDVFNVGAALYNVLTGQSLPSILPGEHESHGFVPREKVTVTPPDVINAAVPHELAAVILKCVSPDEFERPTVTHLKRYLHGLQLRLEYGAV